MTILVTGGLGYIGSHCVADLIENGFRVIILDNLSRSDKRILTQLEKLTRTSLTFYPVDACDLSSLQTVFETHSIQGIIHFAAYKSVNESVTHPLLYYRNNVISLLNIMECIRQYRVSYFIFSSSCTVYGNPESLPVTENTPILPATSPYGTTKQICENIINDYYRFNQKQKTVILRYFNPAGAHYTGIIGELPIGKPQNLVPAITQTAIGKIPQMQVFGTDYPTRDGSCLRDFIHIEDLAHAHTLSLKYFSLSGKENTDAITIFNIGTGNGITVMETIRAFEATTRQQLNYILAPRRPGDVPAIYTSKEKAEKILKWKAKRTLKDMVQSAWQWECNLKNGIFL